MLKIFSKINNCETCRNGLFFWQMKCPICRYRVRQRPQKIFLSVSILMSLILLVFAVEFVVDKYPGFSPTNSYVRSKDRSSPAGEEIVDQPDVRQPEESFDQKASRIRNSSRHIDQQMVESHIEKKRRNK